MRDSLHESLSALVDGEAEELETARVLRAMGQPDGAELVDQWDRWHLVRAVLAARGDSSAATAPASLRGRVLAALADDGVAAADWQPPASGTPAAGAGPAAPAGQPVATAEPLRRLPGWLRPAASVAVAAGVAAVVVMGFNPGTAPGVETPAVLVAGPARVPPGLTVQPVATGVPLAPVVVRARTTADLELAARRRMQAYMLRHVQHRAVTDQSTMMPLVRVAAFEGQ